MLWPTGDADAQGYEEIEARAANAYEHWVGSEGSASGGATTTSDSATSSSSTGRRSTRTARLDERVVVLDPAVRGEDEEVEPDSETVHSFRTSGSVIATAPAS